MKLSGWTIFVVGLSIAIVALSYAYFHQWEPNMVQAKAHRTHAEAMVTEINKAPQAKKRVEAAIKQVEEKTAAWAEIAAEKTPPGSVDRGGVSVAVNGWQLTVDSRRFRNSIQRAVNAQVKRGGVLVVAGPDVPDPGMNASTVLAEYYNYPAINFPVVIFDLGAVTVRGTYDQIMANVRAWKDMPNYLAVTDGLQINGTSPQLTGTYNLSIVGYIRGDEVFPAVPEGAAGAAPGQAGGAAPAGRGGGGRGPRGGDGDL